MQPSDRKRLASAWAGVLTRHPRLISGALILTSLLAVAGLSRLGFEDSTRALRRGTADERARIEALQESFGDNKELVVVLFESENVLAPRVLAETAGIGVEIRELAGVAWVYGVQDLLDRDAMLAASPRRLLSHPLAQGHLISEDAGELLLLARLRRSTSRSILDARETLEAIRSIVRQESSPGLVARLTGTPFLRLETVETLRSSALYTNGLAFALCLLLAVPLLRSWRRTVAALLGPVLAIIWLLGALGWLGIPLTPMSLIAPALVLAVGLTDSVHLIHAWDRARNDGRGATLACAAAVDATVVPCLLTSVTTALAFASLLLADLPLIQQFGLVCAAGSLLAGLAVLVVVPLLLTRDRVEAAGRRPAGEGVLFARLVAIVLGRPRVVAGLALLLALALGATAMRLQPDYRIAEVLPNDSPAYAALGPIERELGGAVWVDVLLTWPPAHDLHSIEVIECLQATHAVLQGEAVTSHPFSILTLLQASPALGGDPLAGVPANVAERLVDQGTRRASIQARIRDLGSRRLEPDFARLERELTALEGRFPGFEIGLTGSNLMTYRGIDDLVHDLRSSLLLALALITATLAVGLRSIVVALACVVPNLLPLLASAATLVWFGEPLRFAAAMALTVGLGVAVDDSIHIAYRFLRLRRRGEERFRAAKEAVLKLGPALAVSTLVLIAAFVALLTHPMHQGRLFGAVAAMTILWALLFDVVFLPPLLVAVSRRRGAESAAASAATMSG